MRLLAIETSCDETAAAVVDHGRAVLSSVVASQIALHRPYGGVVPELASRQHITALLPVIRQALAEADLTLDAIDGVAATRGPGLAGALLVGLNAAKAIAFSRGLPFVGVNHLLGHVYSAWLHPAAAPAPAPPGFPLVCLIVSGGHTDLVLMTDHGRFRLLGATLDDAAGEAFDKAARLLGLDYPGGPSIQRAAAGGDPGAFALPRAWLPETHDFSFSGLKTALLRLTAPYRLAEERHVPQPDSAYALHEPTRLTVDAPVADLAASFQAAVVDVLASKTAAAARQHGASCVVVAGGVAANAALRTRLTACLDRPLFLPALAYCTDNAAMIGAAGFQRLATGERDGWAVGIAPGLPLVAASGAPPP